MLGTLEGKLKHTMGVKEDLETELLHTKAAAKEKDNYASCYVSSHQLVP